MHNAPTLTTHPLVQNHEALRSSIQRMEQKTEFMDSEQSAKLHQHLDNLSSLKNEGKITDEELERCLRNITDLIHNDLELDSDEIQLLQGIDEYMSYLLDTENKDENLSKLYNPHRIVAAEEDIPFIEAQISQIEDTEYERWDFVPTIPEDLLQTEEQKRIHSDYLRGMELLNPIIRRILHGDLKGRVPETRDIRGRELRDDTPNVTQFIDRTSRKIEFIEALIQEREEQGISIEEYRYSDNYRELSDSQLRTQLRKQKELRYQLQVLIEEKKAFFEETLLLLRNPEAYQEQQKQRFEGAYNGNTETGNLFLYTRQSSLMRSALSDTGIQLPTDGKFDSALTPEQLGMLGGLANMFAGKTPFGEWDRNYNEQNYAFSDAFDIPAVAAESLRIPQTQEELESFAQAAQGIGQMAGFLSEDYRAVEEVVERQIESSPLFDAADPAMLEIELGGFDRAIEAFNRMQAMDDFQKYGFLISQAFEEKMNADFRAFKQSLEQRHMWQAFQEYMIQNIDDIPEESFLLTQTLRREFSYKDVRRNWKPEGQGFEYLYGAGYLEILMTTSEDATETSVELTDERANPAIKIILTQADNDIIWRGGEPQKELAERVIEQIGQLEGYPDVVMSEDDFRTEIQRMFANKGRRRTLSTAEVAVDFTIGDEVSSSVEGNRYSFTMPKMDTFDADGIREALESSPHWANLPEKVQQAVIGSAAECFKEEQIGSEGGRSATEINPEIREANEEKLFERLLNGLTKENFVERLQKLNAICLEYHSRDRAEVYERVKTHLTPEKVATILEFAQANLEQTRFPSYEVIHVEGAIDPYLQQLQFLNEWVNITNYLYQDQQSEPLDAFMQKFPGTVPTDMNTTYIASQLAILKAVSGDQYGRYLEGILAQFEEQYLSPPTIEALEQATEAILSAYQLAGNKYRSTNFPNLEALHRQRQSQSVVERGFRENRGWQEPFTATGLVRVESRDGRNLSDDLFETMYETVQQYLHPIQMDRAERDAFLRGMSKTEATKAEMYFNLYGKTLGLELEETSGVGDDLRDLAQEVGEVDGLTGLSRFIGRITERGSNKLANYVNRNPEAYREQMFAGQVDTPRETRRIMGGIPVMEIQLKDGTELGYMYVVDMDSGRFEAEMLGINSRENQWSSERVVAERPNMVIETVGVFADNLSKGPAWAMGVTNEEGEREVLNSYFSDKDGIMVIRDGRMEILHRADVARTALQRREFLARFEQGEFDNFAQAQLLLFNGQLEHNGQPLVQPVNTYKDRKRIIAINGDGQLCVIKLTENVTFYETAIILQQLGMQAALNMDKVGGVHDHHVSAEGEHIYDNQGGSMNYVSKFVVLQREED